ncbi:MAG: glycosyltransferase family 2 protein [Chloroflexota bacterium]|nr:glycosyltransferase family 2 protein [Chloroflexota bacterium]
MLAAGPYPSRDDIERGYVQLLDLFGVDISSFERRRYVNLSQEPNKAANLNSYIRLIGENFKEVVDGDTRHLVGCDKASGTLTVPTAEYVVNVDADSILLPEYVSTLIRFMEEPGNERVAVVQTPYSAVPGARTLLERLGGATTDIQYIIHQGFTRYGATFWVGANALIRRAALDDIAYVECERGFEVVTYIKDRTVIEDTESTIDLVTRGWQLHNYPDRLSYSATPPDFGALLIQRRRWANGGLLILPQLLSYLSGGSFTVRKVAEGLVRFHYLTSIAGVNAGLLLLLTIPLEDNSAAFWLALASLPYYYIYARDLKVNGYRWSDVFRVYALNLMLLPVNLGGVLKSLKQAWTGRKIPFGRTPKTNGRTSAPPGYLLAEYGLLTYCALAFCVDIVAGRYRPCPLQLGERTLLRLRSGEPHRLEREH